MSKPTEAADLFSLSFISAEGEVGKKLLKKKIIIILVESVSLCCTYLVTRAIPVFQAHVNKGWIGRYLIKMPSILSIYCNALPALQEKEGVHLLKIHIPASNTDTLSGHITCIIKVNFMIEQLY